MKIRVEKTSFRDRPILQIFDDEAKPEYRDVPIINIGLRKARAILAAQDSIADFINKYKRK